MNVWNRRKLWGVSFTPPKEQPMLLGEAWDSERKQPPGAPTRALLFNTRREARKWCRERMRQWAKGDAILRAWRVRPVRVLETVTLAILLAACSAQSEPAQPIELPGVDPETACEGHGGPVGTAGNWPFYVGVLCADDTYIRL